MTLLYAELLGGIVMNPGEQEITIAARIVEQFLEQTTDRLIIVVVALFVIFLILGALVTLYLLRNQGKRESSTNTVVTQLSLIITQQNKALEAQDNKHAQRDDEYRVLFTKVLERNEKADDLHKQSADTLQMTQGALRDMSERQAESLEVLTAHDQWAQGSVERIMTALTSVETKLDATGEKLDALSKSVELKFPSRSEWDRRVSEIKRELEAAREACEEAKRKTDEHEKPDIAPPAEDASALSPGADAQEAA